jgi:hemerythrin-like metal-binding protein
MASSDEVDWPAGKRPPPRTAPELGHEKLLPASVERTGPGTDPRAPTQLSLIEQYTREHFAAEARLMRECSYPEEDRHLRHHHEFAARLGRLCQDVRAGHHAITATDYGWVLDWLERHIEEEDLQLKRHLDSRRHLAGAASGPRQGPSLER